jgi:TrmH family RNA methyltransferase
MVHLAAHEVGALDPPFALVAVGLQDPGNAGALLRSAAASGAGGVVFCSGCVDVYNPKAVRASAGAIFRVPLCVGPAPEEMVDLMGGLGLRLLAAAPDGGTDYADLDLTAPTALVFGGEAAGLPAAVRERVDGLVTVQMHRSVESMNVAMAATVLCFEAARQRRAGPPS